MEESGRQRDMLLQIAEVIHEWEQKRQSCTYGIEHSHIAENALLKIRELMKNGR